MQCAHLFNNGAPRFGSIHSTLAYTKCRCHRPDTSNKLQSLRENHPESTNDKLFKRVAFAHVAKDSPQSVLPSLRKSVDHHSEKPLIESSFSELTPSSSKLPTLKRYNDIFISFIKDTPNKGHLSIKGQALWPLRTMAIQFYLLKRTISL